MNLDIFIILWIIERVCTFIFYLNMRFDRDILSPTVILAGILSLNIKYYAANYSVNIIIRKYSEIFITRLFSIEILWLERKSRLNWKYTYVEFL